VLHLLLDSSIKIKKGESVMKIIVNAVLISMLMIVAVPAYSGGVATQLFKCEMNDDASEKDVKAFAAKWLKAAKTMKGGENLQAHVFFPVAVNNMGETDMIFAISAPSFAEWGLFWDSYGDSPAAAADKENDMVACPDSALWESIKIK
jgi:hypothetical protein